MFVWKVKIFHPEEISSMGSIKEDTTLESVRDNYYAGQVRPLHLH